MLNAENQVDNTIEKPGLVLAGLIYSLVSVLLITVGSFVQKREFYSGILITEFILILLPPVLFLASKKYDIRRVLRLNSISFLNLFIILFMMLFSLWIVNVLNIFNLWLIKSIFGQVILPSIPVATSGYQDLIGVLVIGSSAGICEEILFRGVIQRSLERFGTFLSIFITGILFGLFHMDFQRFIGTFLLGILIGFIVYRTNSLYGGMFAHFANNSLAVLISFFARKLAPLDIAGIESGETYINDYFGMLESIPDFQLTVVIIVWIISIMFCGAALAGLIYAFVKNTSRRREEIKAAGRGRMLPVILAFSPGLAVIAFMYILIGYGLSGEQMEFISRLFGLFGL